jgi:hypothetical protein
MNYHRLLPATAFVMLATAVAAFGATPISTAPYTITTPGTYQLTANLNVSGGTNAILISASNVTLDLSGYSITCTRCGTASGIVATGSATLIENGSVSGFDGGTAETPGAGIFFYAGAEGRVSRMSVQDNSTGVLARVGVNLVVEDSTFILDGVGVNCGECMLLTVVNSRILESFNQGIEMGAGFITQCQIVNNLNYGIEVYPTANSATILTLVQITNTLVQAPTPVPAIHQVAGSFLTIGSSTISGSTTIDGSPNVVWMSSAGACFVNSTGDINPCPVQHQTP